MEEKLEYHGEKERTAGEKGRAQRIGLERRVVRGGVEQWGGAIEWRAAERHDCV